MRADNKIVKNYIKSKIFLEVFTCFSQHIEEKMLKTVNAFFIKKA